MRNVFKNKKSLFIIFSFISIFFFQTIAYSAFSSTMNITGNSYARVDADIRITNFSVHEVSNNTITSYEEFSKDSIASNLTLPNNTSYVIYKVEVTNYGSNNMGILDITGLQSNLSYELIDYNLKDKICDENNKCNNLAKKTFYIKITGNQGTYNLNLSFNFKPFYKITYTNLSNNNYQSEIIHNDTLTINIGNVNAPGILVLSGGVSTDNYSYKNGELKVPKVTNNIEVKGISIIENFDYTGTTQNYEIPYHGIYKLETWGAQGGDGYYGVKYDGGAGGYSVGNISLNANDKLYVVVGGKGASSCVNSYCAGGYNGGGESGNYFNDADNYLGGGGGATHIATKNELLSRLSRDISSVLIVSGGGGGSGSRKDDGWRGGAGGGYIGNDCTPTGVIQEHGTGATQSSGGWTAKEGTTPGSFGQAGYFSGNKETLNHNGPGGGGGLYGGGFMGGAGSGYIGNSLLTNKHMTCYNCSTSTEESTKTISTTNASETPTSDYAKLGNGYARITLVSMMKRLDEATEVTDYSVYETTNATSTNNSFTPTTLSSNITLSSNTSTITYKIDVTNFGTTPMGINNITGLPSNLTYELIDYDLKSKICDQNGNCNNDATKTFYIKISGISGTYNLNLSFDFKPFYKITYTNLTNNNYQSEIIHNDTLTINIGNDNAPGVLISSAGTSTDKYLYKNGILKVPNITSNIEVKGISVIENFDYNGGEQNYEILYPGIYKLETWGAQGGVINSTRYGGYGGYSTGNIRLNQNAQLYINVGGQGKTITGLQVETAGGYNGGGNAISSFTNKESSVASGGGATSVCFVSGLLETLNNNIDDIISISGGGGGYFYDPLATSWGTVTSGNGGGIEGTQSTDKMSSSTANRVSAGATQTTGYAFGKGAGCKLGAECGGAGGGLYGGNKTSYTGSGGSGYIGNSLLTNKHMTCYNCKTSDEESTKTISTTNVSETPTADYAKKGNGYARITLIEMIKE